MKLPRRKFLHLVAGAAALPAASRFARAQAYPARPVRLIVGFAAGGTTDITARLMGQWLSERLGQPIIVDNRPGANGNIGTEAAVRAPAACTSWNAARACPDEIARLSPLSFRDGPKGRARNPYSQAGGYGFRARALWRAPE